MYGNIPDSYPANAWLYTLKMLSKCVISRKKMRENICVFNVFAYVVFNKTNIFMPIFPELPHTTQCELVINIVTETISLQVHGVMKPYDLYISC